MAKNDEVAHSFQPLMGAHGGQVADLVIEAHIACKNFRRFYGVPAALRRRPLIR